MPLEASRSSDRHADKQECSIFSTMSSTVRPDWSMLLTSLRAVVLMV